MSVGARRELRAPPCLGPRHKEEQDRHEADSAGYDGYCLADEWSARAAVRVDGRVICENERRNGGAKCDQHSSGSSGTHLVRQGARGNRAVGRALARFRRFHALILVAPRSPLSQMESDLEWVAAQRGFDLLGLRCFWTMVICVGRALDAATSTP